MSFTNSGIERDGNFNSVFSSNRLKVPVVDTLSNSILPRGKLVLDSNDNSLYVSDGSGWILVGPSGSGSGNLQDVLNFGNTSTGRDIILSTGDSYTSSGDSIFTSSSDSTTLLSSVGTASQIQIASEGTANNSILIDTDGGVKVEANGSPVGVDVESQGKVFIKSITNPDQNSILIESLAGGMSVNAFSTILLASSDTTANSFRIESGGGVDVEAVDVLRLDRVNEGFVEIDTSINIDGSPGNIPINLTTTDATDNAINLVAADGRIIGSSRRVNFNASIDTGAAMLLETTSSGGILEIRSADNILAQAQTGMLLETALPNTLLEIRSGGNIIVGSVTETTFTGGDVTFDGNKLLTDGTPPIVTNGTVTPTSTDVAGIYTVNASSSTVLTFGTAFASVPVVVVSPINAEFSDITLTNVTGANFTVQNNIASPVDFNYVVIGLKP